MTSEDCRRELLYTPDKVSLVKNISDLLSDHEEADTSLIVHTIHASKTLSTFIISSPDTDVVILTLAILTGTKSRHRFLDIKLIASKLEEDMTDALIGLLRCC